MESQAVRIAKKFKNFLHESKLYMKKSGVHPPEGQNLVLILLMHHNLLTPTEIGQKMNIRSAAVAELLNKLERNGLVQRVKDKNDLRKTRVEITSAGQARVLELSPNESVIDGIFAGLDQIETDQLEYLIDKLITNLDTINHNDKH